MKLKEFELALEVRDYECDMQGIVNNSVYQNYLEHARHGMLKEMNMNFKEVFDEGMVLVVARVNLQYKAPLKNDDKFIVKSSLHQENMKLVFNQKIIRPSDNTLALKGEIIVVCTVNGSLCMPSQLIDAIENFNVG
ncbi:MAG: acyl-CoA thioesterase [Bacteroidales bacterium]